MPDSSLLSSSSSLSLSVGSRAPSCAWRNCSRTTRARAADWAFGPFWKDPKRLKALVASDETVRSMERSPPNAWAVSPIISSLASHTSPPVTAAISAASKSSSPHGFPPPAPLAESALILGSPPSRLRMDAAPAAMPRAKYDLVRDVVLSSNSATSASSDPSPPASSSTSAVPSLASSERNGCLSIASLLLPACGATAGGGSSGSG
mmetsp:Transcript_22410/g.50625  ORF Transcript_22410/g.50625 Transcript_22410/m.50625 type:complete len:206 (-) Transcript_22410:261-878(-)